ncbi:MAG: peptidylprolyl isomerase [Bradymonadia bacterium]
MKAWLGGVLGCVAAFGCLSAVWVGSASAQSEVVATGTHKGVEFSITASAVAQWLSERPEDTPRQAVDHLVAVELLSIEAAAAGFADHPDVRGAVSPVLIHRYLRDQFEADVRPGNLPEHYLRRAYAARRGYFNHPELRFVAHWVITTEDGKSPTDPAQAEGMRALCAQVQAETLSASPESRKAFLDHVAQYAEPARAMGLMAKGEGLPPFSNPGGYDPVFTEAAFAMYTPNEISPPVQTRFGCHVIWLEKAKAARSDGYETAKAELEEKLLDIVRTEELKGRFATLSEVHEVQVLAQP